MKVFRLRSAAAGSARFRTQSSISGDIDVSCKVTNRQQLNATPQSFHCPAFWFSSNTSLSNAGYKVECLTNGTKLLRYNGTSMVSVAEVFNAASSWGVGTESTLRVTRTGGSITIYRNGTSVLTYSDGSPYTSGHIGGDCLDSQSQWDDFSGTISENFEALATGTISSGTNFGIFHLLQADLAEIVQTEFTLAADKGSVTLTGQNADLLTERVLAADKGTVTLTGHDATLTFEHATFTLIADKGSVAITGPAVSLRAERIMAITGMALAALANAVALLHVRRTTLAPMEIAAAPANVLFRPWRIIVLKNRNNLVTLDEAQFVVDPDGYVVGIVQSPGRISYFPRTDEDSARGIVWFHGEGSPEGAVKAKIGALYTRSDGAAGSTLYVKESGDNTTTGWVAK